MIGMNLIFHIAATLGIVGLLWWVIRLQRQRDLLSSLMNETAFANKKRIRLQAPASFLEQFSQALGVPFEQDDDSRLPPARIKADVFSKVFVDYGICAIKCSRENDQLLAELTLGHGPATTDLETTIKDALGGQVVVRVGVHE